MLPRPNPPHLIGKQSCVCTRMLEVSSSVSPRIFPASCQIRTLAVCLQSLLGPAWVIGSIQVSQRGSNGLSEGHEPHGRVQEAQTFQVVLLNGLRHLPLEVSSETFLCPLAVHGAA